MIPRNLKGGIRSLFDPVLMLWGSGQSDGHIWRRVIVPPGLAQSFGAICTSLLPVYHTIT